MLSGDLDVYVEYTGTSWLNVLKEKLPENHLINYDDLNKIYNYGFNKFGETKEDKYLNQFYDKFDRIEENPLVFPEAINYRGVDRFCVSGVDKIYFNILDSEIEIITIIGRQDF